MRTWLCLLLTALLLSSCGTATKNHASPSPQSQKGSQPRVLNNQQTGRTNANTGAKQGQTLETHLESIANRVPGVKSANCILFGDTAVVGLDVDGNLDRSRVGTIKYSVAEALRKDPHGANAIVTADVDLSHRISDISHSIRQGHPLSGFGNELSDIIGRIVPQLPRDVTPSKAPATPPKAQGRGTPKNIETPRQHTQPQRESNQQIQQNHGSKDKHTPSLQP